MACPRRAGKVSVAQTIGDTGPKSEPAQEVDIPERDGSGFQEAGWHVNGDRGPGGARAGDQPTRAPEVWRRGGARGRGTERDGQYGTARKSGVSI
jgi:hypothetical protein